MKIIVAGGGTAGHVNAGITILDEIKKKYPKTKTLFIGTKRGLEKDLVPKAGYDVKFIRARGLNRESFFVLFYSLCLIPFSIIHSLFIILKFKPDAVIGVGGFASGPFVLAGSLLRKPIFLLEQNAVMGFTNRMLIRFAKKIFVAFPLANIKKSDAHKAVITGNPIRSSISPSSRYKETKLKKDTLNIFVFGGSQGARAINNCIAAAIPALNKLKSIKIIHQTGKPDHQKMIEAYKDAKFEYEVHDYIYGINKIYDQTDLVIARSGASTIFELIAARVPSILIPLPTAADNHQYYNALFLSEKGGTELIEQKKVRVELLLERISYYQGHMNELDNMSNKLKQIEFSKKRPEQIIIETIESVINVR
ncbi:MAG: undecaprenyldiphospho-muramoylpentapeptide beta-N-acetylglucosaminyltransferase [bacterium]